MKPHRGLGVGSGRKEPRIPAEPAKPILIRRASSAASSPHYAHQSTSFKHIHTAPSRPHAFLKIPLWQTDISPILLASHLSVSLSWSRKSPRPWAHLHARPTTKTHPNDAPVVGDDLTTCLRAHHHKIHKHLRDLNLPYLIPHPAPGTRGNTRKHLRRGEPQAPPRYEPTFLSPLRGRLKDDMAKAVGVGTVGCEAPLRRLMFSVPVRRK